MSEIQASITNIISRLYYYTCLSASAATESALGLISLLLNNLMLKSSLGLDSSNAAENILENVVV